VAATAATHRGVLGVRWRSRYRNAERERCDGPNNNWRTKAFHRLLTSFDRVSSNFPVDELDAPRTLAFKATGIKTR
jgi:hypothetical protein